MAIRALTTALLQRDFGLKFDIPSNTLCPTIPNRLDYLHFIEDCLLDSFSTDDVSELDKRPVLIVDIGAGCSCIYPLLGVKLHSHSWKFVAVDIQERAIEYASRNILNNELQDHIVVHQNAPGTIIPIDKELWRKWFKLGRTSDTESALVFMCNPPFYRDNQRRAKQTQAQSSCAGNETEMQFEGGEVEFILRMIKDTLWLHDNMAEFKTRFHGGSSLMGFKSTRQALQDRVADDAELNQRVHFEHWHVMKQGKTRRWAVWWSFKTVKMES